jgi:hypothetical protein
MDAVHIEPEAAELLVRSFLPGLPATKKIAYRAR